jgi:hypothetical protein
VEIIGTTKKNGFVSIVLKIHHSKPKEESAGVQAGG